MRRTSKCWSGLAEIHQRCIEGLWIILKKPFPHSPMTCQPWERKPNWASAVWPKLSHQYQSLSNCGSWGNMWEEGKHLPCHYSRLSQFTPTPNLQLPLPSFHPSTSVCCTTVNGRGGQAWRWALQIVTPAALLKGASFLLTTLYGGGERESRPLTWARAGTRSQPGPSWQIGNELLCVVRLRFGHCAPPEAKCGGG